MGQTSFTGNKSSPWHDDNQAYKYQLERDKPAPEKERSFIVDRGVPVPRKKSKLKKYPFDRMEIGDSFSVSLDEYEQACRSAYAYASKKGVKFSCRKLENTGRIWRVDRDYNA